MKDKGNIILAFVKETTSPNAYTVILYLWECPYFGSNHGFDLKRSLQIKDKKYYREREISGQNSLQQRKGNRTGSYFFSFFFAGLLCHLQMVIVVAKKCTFLSYTPPPPRKKKEIQTSKVREMEEKIYFHKGIGVLKNTIPHKENRKRNTFFFYSL